MWIFTELGEMYSAVNHRTDEGQKVVRSRDIRSSNNLAAFVNELREDDEKVTVIQGGSVDYEFRVYITSDEWETFLLDRAETSKATNFKSEVAKNIGHQEGKAFLNALHDTWQVWFDFQEKKSGHRHSYIMDEDSQAYTDWWEGRSLTEDELDLIQRFERGEWSTP